MGQIFYFKSVRPLTRRNQAAASIADLCRVLNASVPEVSLHDRSHPQRGLGTVSQDRKLYRSRKIKSIRLTRNPGIYIAKVTFEYRRCYIDCSKQRTYPKAGRRIRHFIRLSTELAKNEDRTDPEVRRKANSSFCEAVTVI